jgi:hypothetical protein
MKKITYLSLIILSLSGSVFSQTFKKGQKVANLGVGLGWGYGLGALASAEIGIADDISLGGFAGISRDSYGAFGYSYSANYVPVGLRGSYHLGTVLENVGVKIDKTDIYLGASGGVFLRFYSNTYTGTNGGVGPLIGGFGGIRYQLKPSLNVYAEAGTPYSTVGVSFKF